MNHHIKYSTAVVSIMLLATACIHHTSEETPWFKCDYGENNPVVLQPSSTEANIKIPQSKLIVYSNTYWSIESDAPQWCTVYPSTGHNEGRFYVKGIPLTSPYDRTCSLSVKDADGNLLYTIPVRQNGVEKTLSVPSGISVSSDGDENIVINVNSNINWEAQLTDEKDAEWIIIGAPDTSNNTLPVIVKPNKGDSREAQIRFYMAEDHSLFPEATTTIKQVEYASSEYAKLKTIREVVSSYEGTITQNIKIEGTVINNAATGNYPVEDTQLLLQDKSRAGVTITFANANLNRFQEGQKLVLWLMGASYSAEENVITGIGSANLISSGDGEDVAVKLDNLDSLLSIRNGTLVTLENITFAIPIGTLYNTSLAAVNKFDGQCNLTIMDSFGNTSTVRTRYEYTDKHAYNITSGAYDLTGIVDSYDGTKVLRLRAKEDMHHTDLTQYKSIVEWYGDKSMISTTGWKPATGSGSASYGVAIADGDKKSSWARKECSKEYGDDNTYWGPSLKNWNSSAQCYYFETSTKNATGDIYATLWSISYSSSVKEMKLEWADGNDETKWTDCGVILEQNNVADGQSNEYPLGTYSVKIPGAQGRDRIIIKVSKATDDRVDGKASAISATGPNYICYFGIFELEQ
jgi:hypothetical protein